MNRRAGVAAAAAAVTLLAGPTACSGATTQRDVQPGLPPLTVVFGDRTYRATLAMHAVPVGRELGTGTYPPSDEFTFGGTRVTVEPGSAVRVAAVAGVDPGRAVTVADGWEGTVWIESTRADADTSDWRDPLAGLPPVVRRLLTQARCTGVSFAVVGRSIGYGWGDVVGGTPRLRVDAVSLGTTLRRGDVISLGVDDTTTGDLAHRNAVGDLVAAQARCWGGGVLADRLMVVDD